jgi:hypothetical protein
MKLITYIVLVAVLALSAWIITGATVPAEAQTSGQACYNRCQREYAQCVTWQKPWICYDQQKSCVSQCKF